VTIETTAYDKILLMMKFILLFSQYNTVQGNVNKQKKRKRKEKEKKQSELKFAYTSTKRACDSLIKISKNFFSNITYITLSVITSSHTRTVVTATIRVNGEGQILTPRHP